jgi:uncharacterized membrane protein YesL
MRRLLALLGRAIAAWWHELVFLLVLNFLWLLAQLTVVLGPPATAALFPIARRVLDREIVDFGDVWRAMRATFVNSWAWGIAQFVVYGVLCFNFLSYRAGSGLLLATLRYTWALLALAWFAVNLYYWPLYYAEEDRRFGVTLANAAKMALLNLNFTVVYALLALFLIGVSVLSGVLLGAVLGVWLSLWGTLVVQDRLVAAGVIRSE